MEKFDFLIPICGNLKRIFLFILNILPNYTQFSSINPDSSEFPEELRSWKS